MVYPGYGYAPYGYGYAATAPLYNYAAPAYGYAAPAYAAPATAGTTVIIVTPSPAYTAPLYGEMEPPIINSMRRSKLLALDRDG